MVDLNFGRGFSGGRGGFESVRRPGVRVGIARVGADGCRE